MLTPLLNWSTGIRQHARTIAVCWGFLMFAALGFTPLKILHGVDPVSDHHQYATCSVDIAKDCKPGKLDENIVILTIDYQNRTRYFLAKAIACIWYIAAWAAAVVCPAVFISSVIIDEIYVWGYPVSEKYDAVGQASHLTSMYSAKEDEKESEAESVSRGRDRIKEEWKDFRLWWQKPVFRSRQPHYKQLESPPQLQPLPTSSSQVQLLAKNPPLLTTLAPQTPGSSATVASLYPETPYPETPYPETPYVPQLPSTARINHPAPILSASGYFDGTETTHETVQRPTFEPKTQRGIAEPG
ncbi:hypothetical protein Q9189_006869 [Teloschistes chrysophthalmus]